MRMTGSGMNYLLYEVMTMNSTMRCPLRTNIAGEMAVCDSECAWLVTLRDTDKYKACAISVKDKPSGELTPWVPVNYRTEVDK